MSYERQCAMKVRWDAVADVVLVGDSRVGVGLSPGAMAEVLPGARIRNAGFGAVAFTDDYLNYVERVLASPATDHPRIIVVGISPLTLTGAHATMNSFVSARRQVDAGERWTHHYLGPWAEWLILFCQPIRDLDELCFTEDGRQPPRLRREVFANGWCADEAGFDSHGAMLDRYESMLRAHEVSDARVGDLVDAVKRWRAAGIHVYAFRPPVPPAMRELEERLGGFDPDAVKDRLIDAGARWIPIDLSAYHTHDGCHLGRDDAVRLSRRIAEAIVAGHKVAGGSP